MIDAPDGDEHTAFKYLDGMFNEGCAGCVTSTENGRMDIEIDYGPFDDDEWESLR